MTVFEFDDYKDYIREQVVGASTRGYQTLLAEAASCQRAFISQVLNSHVHLTLDHAAGLCQFWSLTELESDYFMELVSLARAGTEPMRALIERRLKNFQRQNADLGKKFLKASELARENQERYYANWSVAAVHVLTSIPDFQTIEPIANRLSLTKHRVEKILQELSLIGVVTRTGNGKWKPTQQDLFLKRDSPMMQTHHWNWKMKALEDAQQKNPDSVHYTVLHALSHHDVVKFRSKLMDFISSSRELVAPSREEQLICFTCDLFQV